MQPATLLNTESPTCIQTRPQTNPPAYKYIVTFNIAMLTDNCNIIVNSPCMYPCASIPPM